MTSLAYAALWIFIFSIPWQNVITLPGLGTVSRLTGLVAVPLALLATLLSAKVRRWNLFHVGALLFVMWCGLGIFILQMPIVPRKIWTYVQLLFMLWMMWELAPSRNRLLGMLSAYVFGAYVSALSTIMVFRRDTGVARRFAAEGFDANDLAATLALALPMAWYLATVHRKPLLRLLFRGYFPVGIVAIGLTGSRGGMLATMVALLIVPLTMTRLSPGRLVTAIAILCVTGMLAMAYIPQTVVQRLATTTTEVQEGRVGGRLKIWVAGMQAFSQKPMLGYGTANFKPAVAPYMLDDAQSAHNSFLSVLVEQGLLGLLLYLVMFAAVFRAALRQPTMERRFALVLFGTLMTVMLPLTWEDQKQVWFVLAAIVGLAYAPPVARRPMVGWEGRAQGVPAGSARLARQRPQPLSARRWHVDTDPTS
jgi:O-antigen ligase